MILANRFESSLVGVVLRCQVAVSAPFVRRRPQRAQSDVAAIHSARKTKCLTISLVD